VADLEGVPCSEDGLEAIIFTAEGDMRNALNNLQATFAGFTHVTKDNVFKVQTAAMHLPLANRLLPSSLPS
jgi:replication factor C subunit 2/4